MDFSMGLVSAILTASIFMPFFYAAYLGKKQDKKINQAFNRDINRLGYYFDKHERWRNTFLGWDKTRSKLVYMRYSSNVLERKEFSISKIMDCKIVVDEKKERKNGKIYSTLLKVDLCLVLFCNDRNPVLLNFYDCNGNYMEDHEVKRAEKWKQLILKNITPIKPLKSAA